MFPDQIMLPDTLRRVLWAVDFQFLLWKTVRFKVIASFYNISLILTLVTPGGACCLFLILCWAFIYRLQIAGTWKRSEIYFSLIFKEKSQLDTTSPTAISFLQWCWTSNHLLGSIQFKFEVLTAHSHRGIWSPDTRMFLIWFKNLNLLGDLNLSSFWIWYSVLQMRKMDHEAP